MTHASANFMALMIRGYQRFISPHKGYSCPHRVLRGGRSCSAHGLRLLRDRPLCRFYPLMRRRFARCRAAAQVLMRNRGLSPEFHPDFAGGPHKHEETTRRGGRCGRFRRRAKDGECWGDVCCNFAPVDCTPDCTPDCGAP